MRRVLLGSALAGVTLLAALMPVGSPASATDDDAELFLITLSGPGSAGYRGDLSATDYRTSMRERQDATLERLGAGEPTYRWTTALNGLAVELTPDQARLAHTLPDVALLERDDIHTLAGAPAVATQGSVTSDAAADASGGRGTVIGVVDSGISPDTPALVSTTSLGETPTDFHGTCTAAASWASSDCNGKLVSATWFVDGFGADRLRSESELSPRDDSGHGTQVASVAAGNAKVTALSSGRTFGTFSGTAPDARLAIYKACWSAPDPADDGCSSADLVSAVDRAVHDRVDVLNLSVVSNSDGAPDTLDLALLGAAERDIFVATAAGNDARTSGYQQPWTTTVGASTGPNRTGALRLGSGDEITGILTARRLPDRAAVIRASDVPAPGHSRADARLCRPGALDAAGVADKIVLCERGVIARVDKSAAVHLADGVGMVLVNAAGESLSADFHSVPTLHVDAAEGARLRRALQGPGTVRGQLVHTPEGAGAPAVLPWSNHGSARAGTVKPDLVAPGFGLLAATSPVAGNGNWELLSGTSAATARVSGLAARLRADHPDWSANRVRSALMTSARQAAHRPTALRQGAGIARGAETSTRPGLVFDLAPSAYRRALDAGRETSRLNLPSAQRRVPARGTVITRSVTNVGKRAMYYSSSARGFATHHVHVLPAAIKIAPGETRDFHVVVRRSGPQRSVADSGSVTWRGANGTTVRIPVLLTR
ncbi:S8 family serine peptidase [Nocardioides jensenii]|uniref:S8 family serine peptidase n=1 Tax=Nocardioides jensenii TaxID=1843 RepID=UPI0009E950A4|nr:S8 family serine peptidase [Nocardioides jensenii]